MWKRLFAVSACCVLSLNSQAIEISSGGKIQFIGSVVESGCVFEGERNGDQPKITCKLKKGMTINVGMPLLF